jgi:mannitol-specific phosphotransferase system IIBC component
MVKYTLARVGLFVVVAAALAPFVHDLILALLISAVVTSIASLFILKRWRNEVAATLQTSMTARRAEKEKLRSALAGDDEHDMRVS